MTQGLVRCGVVHWPRWWRWVWSVSWVTFVHEGASGIIGPYLLTLGASAAVVGLVSGVGEYALGAVTGWFVDRTGGYWTMIFFGYGLTVVVVPSAGSSWRQS